MATSRGRTAGKGEPARPAAPDFGEVGPHAEQHLEFGIVLAPAACRGTLDGTSLQSIIVRGNDRVEAGVARFARKH